MNQLLFIIGMPGSGKTTLAKSISSEIGISFIDSDSDVVADYVKQFKLNINSSVYEISSKYTKCISTCVWLPLSIASDCIKIGIMQSDLLFALKNRENAYAHNSDIHWSKLGAYRVSSIENNIQEIEKKDIINWFTDKAPIPDTFIISNN